MTHFAGLDVSTKTTSVCVITDDGEVVLETSVATEPDAIAAALQPYRRTLKKAGHETGSLAPWLHKGLRKSPTAELSRELLSADVRDAPGTDSDTSVECGGIAATTLASRTAHALVPCG